MREGLGRFETKEEVSTGMVENPRVHPYLDASFVIVSGDDDSSHLWLKEGRVSSDTPRVEREILGAESSGSERNTEEPPPYPQTSLFSNT